MAIEAAKEAEFVRPNTGRRMFKLLGAGMAGGATGGVTGAGVAMLIAEVWERARAAGVTTQFKVGQLLAKTGDALKMGRPAQALQFLQEAGEPLGVVIPGVARAQGGPVAVPVAGIPAPTGVPTIGPPADRR
jgi:hypothetical protein